MASPGFWQDRETAQHAITQLKGVKAIVAEWTSLDRDVSDADVLLTLAAEENDDDAAREAEKVAAGLEKRIESFELKSLLSGEYAAMGAILEINPGAGGTDCQDWAAMLHRMYLRWAERSGYAAMTVDFQEGQEAGIKSASVEIRGDFAYGYLRSEIGVHRLVRISPFDAQRRRHTSFSSVMVLPLIEGEGDLEISPDDLKIDTFRSSGAGGQHVNKTESAVRLTHIPTGITVSCQSERSQHRNRESAMRILRSRLLMHKHKEQEQKRAQLAGEKKPIEWSSQIRSYVFHPYTLVKDHRTGCETSDVEKVADGEIDIFIDAYLKGRRQEDGAK